MRWRRPPGRDHDLAAGVDLDDRSRRGRGQRAGPRVPRRAASRRLASSAHSRRHGDRAGQKGRLRGLSRHRYGRRGAARSVSRAHRDGRALDRANAGELEAHRGGDRGRNRTGPLALSVDRQRVDQAVVGSRREDPTTRDRRGTKRWMAGAVHPSGARAGHALSGRPTSLRTSHLMWFPQPGVPGLEPGVPFGEGASVERAGSGARGARRLSARRPRTASRHLSTPPARRR